MKTIQTLTPWIDGSIKPFRPGVYQRKAIAWNVVYSKWTGDRWQAFSRSVFNANDETIPSGNQSLQWRGLTEKP